MTTHSPHDMPPPGAPAAPAQRKPHTRRTPMPKNYIYRSHISLDENEVRCLEVAKMAFANATEAHLIRLALHQFLKGANLMDQFGKPIHQMNGVSNGR
jgi:hypothetical protein